MQKNHILRFALPSAGAVLLFSATLHAQLSIPNLPLTTQTNAKPMTMIVASKDHRLFYEAYNDASDIDGDGVLDIRFKPNIVYFGLFDSNLCYTYSGSGPSGLFTPANRATNGKCPGQWSGNWLNYVTTSRIDTLRKVLYGGHREVDTADRTILRRTYIPQDAHSWAKEYTSANVDGYRISDYTPLGEPGPGRRHFFGNLTANANVNCAILNNCSDLPPLLSVVTNSTKRVWEWASKERPVLDDSHGGTRTNYTVRVEVCTTSFHDDCKQYPSGKWKPVGVLHDYGENDAMLFGLITGSYDRNMAGGRLRKVVSSFKSEINPYDGTFSPNATIVRTFDRLRIRDFNNGRTDIAYRSGWVTTRAPYSGEFADWGAPVAELMYEAVRYFAGKKKATPEFAGSTTTDDQVGLPSAAWDDPYDTLASAAKAPYCARANMLTISDINVSYDSDQLPGVAPEFGSGVGDALVSFNASDEATYISSHESGITGLRFIGQVGTNFDSTPSPKNITSLANIRGLAPEEPTKQGSYYSASVAAFAKRGDLRSDLPTRQSIDTFIVALASPLPRIEVPLNGGRRITLVPFAKSVSGGGINAAKGQYQPTNQIVDFYVDTLANTSPSDYNPNVNGGRYYAKFRINFEDVEQGADHDMDAIVEYTIALNADNSLSVTLRPVYQAGGIRHRMGYIISGTTADGIYLEVQDEADETPYFLNTPPGRTPGYCDPPDGKTDCRRLPYLGGSSTSSPRMDQATRTFVPGSAPAAALLKDPLWYAAKWGGFVDRNGNGRPDLAAEWDANGDGIPDTYFLVQNPLKLKESLRRTLDSIVERSAAAGNVASNSSSYSSESAVYQSTFNSANWSGELLAFSITSSGLSASPLWRASQQMPSPNDRRIFTRTDGTPREFTWANLSTPDKIALGNSDVLDYIRGVRSKEIQNGGTLRNRASTNIIGDIVHSTPFFAKDTNTLYIGANDGMLHSFDAVTGRELFAYIPSVVIPRLKNLSDPAYMHEFFVDGEIEVSRKAQTGGRNYLVATLGRGGRGLFGLDVSNPSSFGSTDVKWECFATGGSVTACNGDADLGHMLGRPIIAKLNDGNWGVIVGNGYNSVSGRAALYIFKLEDGTLLKKIDTMAVGDNGLATPGTFDLDGNGTVDLVYAGDLKGNVWKFDLTSSNKTQWRVAFNSGSLPAPLFKACSSHPCSATNTQPVTAQITVAVNDIAGDPNEGKRFIFFGTGSYFRSTDPGDTQTQTWYGIVDDDSPVSGRSELKQRTISETSTFDGKKARVFSDIAANDMNGKRGWYLDFNTEAGERIVTSSKLYRFIRPALVASSIIPVQDPCVPGGRGYVNVIDPFTGTRVKEATLDVNNNGDFADDKLNGKFISSFDPGVGMPGEAKVVGDRLVVGGSDGSMTSVRVNIGTKRIGRISWREIVLN
jgi:type IV pilus assembly protein PilY1